MNKTIRVALITGLVGAILGSFITALLLGALKPAKKTEALEEVVPSTLSTTTWHEIVRLGENWDSLSINEKEEDRGRKTWSRKDFYVSSNEWRISWKTITISTDYGDIGLTIFVYDASDKACIETIRSSSRRDKDSYDFRGPGSYFIETGCRRTYEVIVEEKY